ncbi:MAG: ion transporter [Gemmatimonadota bacterium]|jgi:voltage-gated potassium channel
MTDQTMQPGEPSRVHGWRATLHEVIFEADTPAGKAFDILLILAILFSVVIVSLESVPEVRAQYGSQLRAAEWTITILFTIEYILRLMCVQRPIVYATSFFGIVDLLAILPTYISVIIPGTQALTVVRVLRLLRIFRVLKLVQYVSEARSLSVALRASAKKIFVFLFVVVMIVVIVGALMYLVEGPENGFDSIPRSIYWAVVTLTTVGYGDIAPGSALGRFIAVCVMILGYGIIAVPTGIVTRELVREDRSRFTTQVCRSCNAEGHDVDAAFCKSCGNAL